MEQYKHVALRDIVKINSIVNASRLEIDKYFTFEGESHDFWEFQYAALGSAIIYTKNEFYELRQGQMTFFRPNKFHLLYGNGQRPAEIWIFSFRCDSPVMEKFDQLLVQVQPECRQLMERILSESQRNFDIVSHPADGRILRRRPNTAFGYEQLIKNRIEELILLLFRSEFANRQMLSHDAVTPHWQPDSLAEEIRLYLQSHTHSTLSLAQIAQLFRVSVTYVKRIYREVYGTSIMADFHRMKIRGAKQALASTELSVQEIATLFDFKNIYYFSSFFKKHTGMTPTQYRSSQHSQ